MTSPPPPPNHLYCSQKNYENSERKYNLTGEGSFWKWKPSRFGWEKRTQVSLWWENNVPSFEILRSIGTAAAFEYNTGWPNSTLFRGKYSFRPRKIENSFFCHKMVKVQGHVTGPPQNGFRERKVYHNFVLILYTETQILYTISSCAIDNSNLGRLVTCSLRKRSFNIKNWIIILYSFCKISYTESDILYTLPSCSIRN